MSGANKEMRIIDTVGNVLLEVSSDQPHELLPFAERKLREWCLRYSMTEQEFFDELARECMCSSAHCSRVIEDFAPEGARILLIAHPGDEISDEDYNSIKMTDLVLSFRVLSKAEREPLSRSKLT